MRTIKSLLLVLVVAIAACRSVPQEVKDAYNRTKTDGAAILVVAEDVLDKIETASSEVNDEYVSAAYNKWHEHYEQLVSDRAVVVDYLLSSKADKAANGYIVAGKLLSDMNISMREIVVHWETMLSDVENNPNIIGKFIDTFRRDIQRYRTLQRKFDEWIEQFRVRG
jgi:hypothetical protein